MFGKKKKEKKNIEDLNNSNFVPPYNSGSVGNGMNQYQYNPNVNRQNFNPYANSNNQIRPNYNQNMNNGYNPRVNSNPNFNNQGYINGQNIRGDLNNQYRPSPFQPGQPGISTEQNSIQDPRSVLPPNQGTRQVQSGEGETARPMDSVSRENWNNVQPNARPNYINRQEEFGINRPNQPLDSAYSNPTQNNRKQPDTPEKKSSFFHRKAQEGQMRTNPILSEKPPVKKVRKNRHLLRKTYKALVFLIAVALVAYLVVVLLQNIGIIV